MECHLLCEVTHQGRTLARSKRTLRLLETSHPPTFYFPPEEVDLGALTPGSASSFCEFKGRAVYFDLAGKRSVAWSYPDPTPAFAALKDYLAFYPGRVEACYVDGERVQAQPGDFYGGWITSHVRGPFKGGPGTAGW